jgi:hypothetical protein
MYMCAICMCEDTRLLTLPTLLHTLLTTLHHTLHHTGPSLSFSAEFLSGAGAGQPMFGAVDVGTDCYWWDYGQVQQQCTL